jgi:hypothetical protein
MGFFGGVVSPLFIYYQLLIIRYRLHNSEKSSNIAPDFEALAVETSVP